MKEKINIHKYLEICDYLLKLKHDTIKSSKNIFELKYNNKNFNEEFVNSLSELSKEKYEEFSNYKDNDMILANIFIARNEAWECFYKNTFIASMVLARTSLEQILVEYLVPFEVRNLYYHKTHDYINLKYMIDLICNSIPKIPSHFKKYINKIKFLGNNSAHFNQKIKTLTIDDINDTLQILDVIIRCFFETHINKSNEMFGTYLLKNTSYYIFNKIDKNIKIKFE